MQNDSILEMLIHNLSGAWDQAKLPAEFSFPNRVTRIDHPEMFCAANQNEPVNQLNAYAANALLALAQGPAAETSVVMIDEGKQYAAEYRKSDGEMVLCTGNRSGVFSAVRIAPNGMRSPVSQLPNPNIDLTAVYAVFIMLIARGGLYDDPAVTNQAAEMLDSYLMKNDPADSMTEVMTLNDIVNYFLKKRCGPENNGLSAYNSLKASFARGNIKLISDDRIDRGSLNGKVLCGTPILLNKGMTSGTVFGARNAKFGQVRKKYESFASSHSWDAAAARFIPKFPDDYPVPPETDEICELFTNSRNFTRPFNNFMWRGITSYGKSTGVEMVAALLNIPLLRITCSSTMEAQDFLSQYVPDSSVKIEAELPSFLDIEADPDFAWERMTGECPEGVTPEQCFLKALEIASSINKGAGNVSYKLIESNYITALKNGWICEVQELSRIKDAGVMVTLNEYDRPGAKIPLADGTFAERAKDAMVIYTDNIGYSSCRPIDPSVMRRMDTVLTSYELSPEQVVSRVHYNTGFGRSTDEKAVLDHMIETWNAIKDYCREQQIYNCDISVNELERWVSVYQILGPDRYEDACMECVVSKVSPDREIQEEIRQAVVDIKMASMPR